MVNRKKTIIAIIITIIVGVLTIAGSFAIWTIQLLGNINVDLNIENISNYVEYTEGIAVFDDNIHASNSYSGGKSTIFTLKKKNNPPYPFYATLNLKINDISDILTQSSVLKWTVASKASGTNNSETVVAYGSFNGTNKGQTIQLLPSIEATSTKTDYIVYLWVDSTNTNSSLVEGGKIDSELWMDVYQYRLPYNETPPNAPELVDGLIPVKLSDSGDTVTTVAQNDSTWYDYNNKKWANAVLVKASGVKTRAQNSVVGTVIDQSDILAYYVWIPRYSYKVWAYDGNDIEGDPHKIPIKFVSTSVKDMAGAKGQWYTHPAFTFGNTELAGIWVGKFETHHTSYTTNSSASLGCTSSSCPANKYNGLRILPNVRPLTSNTVSSFFFASRAMETSGNDFGINPSTTDSHMMKNSEWGAVAYLSHSKYGINDEIRINNTYNIVYNESTRTFLTGCGASTPNASTSRSSTCDIQYGGVSRGNYPQSTTGNVTGVFDMSGGTYEYVMGTYNNDNSYGNSAYSGFNSSTNPLPDTKYYDNYPNPPFDDNMSENLYKCTFVTCGGHATYETQEWYVFGTFVDSELPWLSRGGSSASVGDASVFFVCPMEGNADNLHSARMVLVADNDE